ncbi:hypothetical protein P43SY_002964 [Pythium insidiosum]|uniref:Queuosine 5'-phosphate N-glycosylase/hydrolase n=1 Tax=Pythium insidiosum TaxID=114742 RepID=A0AAD5Q7W4_PYTIN|nr:hypothetical protein P43SY_002964 [Pythium insidiosum]
MAPSHSSTAREPLLARVRSSCAAQLRHDGCVVAIDNDKIRAFLDELDWAQYEELAAPQRFPLNFRSLEDEYEELAAPQRFPLNFRSLEDEVNFLTLLALLSFGSGYRKELHKYTQRLFGLIGLYISVSRLDADYMANVSIDVLADFFSLPLDRDEEISPGIYVSKPVRRLDRRNRSGCHGNLTGLVRVDAIQGPLRPLAEMMHKAVQECGQKLKERGFADFGAFVLAHLHAAHLVESLVETFPAFDDHRESHGTRCYFLKRAQLVAVSLYRRFQCSAQLAEHIDRGENLPPGDWESDLRAGAIVACDRIVRESKGRVTNLELDTYLWRVGKEPRFRSLERHATRETFFY